MIRKTCVSFIAVLIVLTANYPAFSTGRTVFGPERFETGIFHVKFARRVFHADDAGEGLLRVVKTDPGNRPDGGFVIVNYRLVPLREFLLSDHASLEENLSLQPVNTMYLFIFGAPGSSVEVSVINEGSQSPLPEVSFSVEPEAIVEGDEALLVWSTAHADSCAIEPGIGSVDENGSTAIAPDATTTYTLTANGPGGSVSAEATITVTPSDEPPSSPEITFSADPAGITPGNQVELSWSVADAEKVHIDRGVGAVALDGSLSVYPQYTTTYTLSATGPGGSAEKKVTVAVVGNPDPLPEGSFGEHYAGIIPADATIEYYDEERFSIITGRVHDTDDMPIPGVRVRVHDHPEYGTARTDDDGRFSLPVEGGSVVTIHYRKQGLMDVHRKVDAPWNDIAIIDAVQMIEEDTRSTFVVFDGNPDTVATHRSTAIDDEFGTRSCTMIFQGANKAYLIDEEGRDAHELTAITVRATEYATLESMPAELPPTSAYTYCIEMSVDGAERVRFEMPVISYVDNFLGFDVGEIVPVGSYDLERGVWIPEKNGVVVELLDTDSDGIVDALDADGDGQADDLNQNGSYQDDVTGLDDPFAYQPGNTYWRFQMSHFSACDCNWPSGPPLDAIAPNPRGVPTVDQENAELEDCPTACGSHVEDRSRILHQDVPIPGTDMRLHYSSNGTDGYQTVISVPASGDSVPASLKHIFVKTRIAGRRFSTFLEPLPGQQARFVWDGFDHLQNRVTQSVYAYIRIGFVYDCIYYNVPEAFGSSWAFGGMDATGIDGRSTATFWKDYKMAVHPVKSAQESCGIADGWTLASKHYMDDVSSIENKGDLFRIQNNISMITTIAGTGESGYGGDGGLAEEATVNRPRGIAVDPSGNIFIADSNNQCIRRVDQDGFITTVAGTGTGGYGWTDDGLAVEAQLWNPRDIDVDRNGNLFIADTTNNRVRRVGTNGIITTVAGNGSLGYSGDGALATGAKLNSPMDVVTDQHGNLFIADAGNNRIRKVDASGVIVTVAGNGEKDYDGDNGPAINASLDYPYGITIDRHGNLFIADCYNHCIRRVDTNGTITTVAGTGSIGYSGDGGPAVEARLYHPRDVEVDDFGNLYIADDSRHCIRRVDTNGIITTIVGTGSPGYNGDGGPAKEAKLYNPNGIALDRNGNLLIADYYNFRIRAVGAPFMLSDAMNIGDVPFADAKGFGYIIDSTGLHTHTIDLDTGKAVESYIYEDFNGQDLIVAVTDSFDNRVGINRDSDGRITAIISPDGVETQLGIDVENHLAQVIYPDHSTYHFEYASDGLLTAKTEPNGNRFEYHYDENGRITDTYDGNGGHWQFDRLAEDDGTIDSHVTTGEGNVTAYRDHTDYSGEYTSTITAPAGDVTVFSQAGDKLSTRKALPCGMEFDIVYDLDSEYRFKYIKEISQKAPSGLSRLIRRSASYDDTDGDDMPDLVTRTVALNNKPTTFKHNILASTKTNISPEGRTVTLHYNPDNVLTERILVPGLFETTFAYDARGRVTSILTNTRETFFTYDDQGHMESVTDPKGHTTTYGYDAMGRVTSVFRPDTSSLSFSYDNNGNVTVVTNPSDIGHGFGFNSVNLMSSYQPPLSGNYSFEYDRDRQLIAKIFPSGKEIRHTYDATRLVQTQTPEGAIDYAYACGDRISAISQGTESLAYEYDGNLMIAETCDGTLNQTLDYTYDHDFRIDTFGYAGFIESYAYDDDGLLTGAGEFTIYRNAENGLPEMVSGGAMSMEYAYNGYGEIENQDVAVNGLGLSSFELARDNNGRIIGKTEVLNGETTEYTYEYDTMGRLVAVTKDGTRVEEYAYNLNGSREYEMNSLRGIAGRSMSYSDEDHLLNAGQATYQYDLDGFLIAKTVGADVTSYTYSSRGELLSVILPDGTVVEYVHDPLGRRIAKKVNGSITEKYLWQGRTRLLAVYDGNDNLKQRFEYADGRMPAAFTREGVTYYPVYDPVGSLRLVADASGNVVKRIDFDSFGNIIHDSNPSFDVPFGFAGGLYDADTGLVRFGFRDYDPDTGRWTAKDPILFAGGDTDLYGYCLNDPVNFVDPSGQVGIAGAVIGGIAGGFTGFLSGIQSGNVLIGIASGALGGLAGAGVGFFLPSASSVVGGAIGGAISGAFGGAVGSVASEIINSGPCISARSISLAAAQGAGVGAIAGMLGGAFNAAAVGVGAGGYAAEIGAANVTAPITWGLGMDW